MMYTTPEIRSIILYLREKMLFKVIINKLYYFAAVTESILLEERERGRMEGRMGGRIGGRMGGRKRKRMEEKKEGRMGGWKGGTEILIHLLAFVVNIIYA